MYVIPKALKSPNLFITFEGIEGSGKTTQIKLLAGWLEEKGHKVLLTREPGGTLVADRIRRFLLDSKTKGVSPATELLLYEVARRDHVEEVIRPALKKGKIVLCDRFTDATVAYQGYGRGLSLRMIENLNTIATGGLKPSLTFLFDLPVAKGLERANRRILKLRKGHPPENRFEEEKHAFHERVRKGYLTLAGREKKRFKVLNAKRPVKEIFCEICREVQKDTGPLKNPIDIPSKRP